LKILDYATIGHPCPTLYKHSRPLDSGQGGLFWLLGLMAYVIGLDVRHGCSSVPWVAYGMGLENSGGVLNERCHRVWLTGLGWMVRHGCFSELWVDGYLKILFLIFLF